MATANRTVEVLNTVGSADRVSSPTCSLLFLVVRSPSATTFTPRLKLLRETCGYGGRSNLAAVVPTGLGTAY